MYSKNDICINPPMGWNSYDYYDTTVTEDDLKRNADYMADNLLQYGYEYIVADIQWSDCNAGTDREHYQYIPFSHFEIDEYGRQLPAVNRFPSAKDNSGFKHIADYIHKKGLKFGIHIMRGIPRIAAHNHLPIEGTDTTADKIANPYSISRWNPDMYGVRSDIYGGQEYYDSIFRLYADWGVDLVKVDDICNTNMYPYDPYSGKAEIEMIYNAIKNCGRQMVLSLSPGPALIEHASHMRKYANMWRITDDFWDNWDLLKAMFERCDVWQRQVSAGCFPDCDMIPIGKIGKAFNALRTSNFSYDEEKLLMSLWCIFRSPLILGGELNELTKEETDIITNEHILYMNTSCHGACQIFRDDNECAWITFDNNSASFFVALFNLSDTIQVVTVSPDELALYLRDEGITLSESFNLFDCWESKTLGNIDSSGSIFATLNPHSASVLRINL